MFPILLCLLQIGLFSIKVYILAVKVKTKQFLRSMKKRNGKQMILKSKIISIHLWLIVKIKNRWWIKTHRLLFSFLKKKRQNNWKSLKKRKVINYLALQYIDFAVTYVKVVAHFVDLGSKPIAFLSCLQSNLCLLLDKTIFLFQPLSKFFHLEDITKLCNYVNSLVVNDYCYLLLQ